LRLILQRVNQLQLGNSGAGIYLVDLETPFLAFCEGDDLWTDPYKLAKQVRFMVDRPWCTISHHDVEIWNEGGDAQYERELREHLAVRQSRSERTPGVALAEGNSILTCSAMVRTDALPSDVLRAIGDVQPEDFLVFAIAADAGDIGFIPEEMSRYRLHGQNYWASMSAPERAAFELESLWFLAVHLTGSMQERITERLVEQLRTAPPAASVAPIARIRHELSAGRAERAALEKSLDASQGALGEALSRIRDVLLQWQASQSTRHARRPD
jgi:hypothetical protein